MMTNREPDDGKDRAQTVPDQKLAQKAKTETGNGQRANIAESERERPTRSADDGRHQVREKTDGDNKQKVGQNARQARTESDPIEEIFSQPSPSLLL